MPLEFDYLIVGAGFVGAVLNERLATYHYYNMDQVVGMALAEFEKMKTEKRKG